MTANSAIRRRWSAVFFSCALLVPGCGTRNRTGELKPPRDAPQWEAKYDATFDDDFTPESIQLAGRAPNDVRDQGLFAARLGFSHYVAIVNVQGVWARGRHQGDKEQFLDIEIQEPLLGTLMRGTNDDHQIRVRAEDPLPGTLRGRQMVFFLRWAPQERPAYHYHLMPADKDLVTYIKVLVRHAKKAGALNEDGTRRKRSRRNVDDAGEDAGPALP